jgi:hypothetical protein
MLEGSVEGFVKVNVVLNDENELSCMMAGN